MKQRNPQANHPRIVPPFLPPKMPRPEPQDRAEEKPGSQGTRGEGRELGTVSRGVVCANGGGGEVEGEVAEEAD